jgi:hypothetical protein
MVDPITIAMVASTGLKLLAGSKQAAASKLAGRLTKEANYANAEDVTEVAAINVAAITGAAENNARAVLRVGEANAIAIERATLNNLARISIQSEEDLRLHKKAEKGIAGEIRAMAASSGFVAELGSPQYHLNAEVIEGFRRRNYMLNKQKLTLLTTAHEGMDRRDITRLQSDQQAEVLIANAGLQAEVAMADAAARAAAMERAGDIAEQAGQANASAAMWGAASSAVSSGIGLWAQSGGFSTPMPASTPVASYSTYGSTYSSLYNSSLPTWS